MNDVERRERVLRAENAILDLERRAAEHISAAESASGASKSLESARAELSTTCEKIVQVTEGGKLLLSAIQEAERKLTTATDQAEALRAQMGEQLGTYARQAAARLDALEITIRSTAEDMKNEAAVAQASLISSTNAVHEDLARKLEALSAKAAQSAQETAERSKGHDQLLDEIRKSVRNLFLVNLGIFIVTATALLLVYARVM